MEETRNEEEEPASPDPVVLPWPSIPGHGDGVSRTDPRTWASASVIQRLVDERNSSSTEENATLIEESTYARDVASKMTSLRNRIADLSDAALSKGAGIEFGAELRSLDELMATVEDSCSRWARVFEDIYHKKEETDDQLVALCQRFWQRCPEYGYPCDPTLKESVYALHPSAANLWSSSVEEIELARQKRAGVPKGALDKDELSIRNAGGDAHTTDDIDEVLRCLDDSRAKVPKAKSIVNTDAPIRLVADTATKREQQYTKAVRNMFTQVPDAHETGSASLTMGKA